jgi:FkbM family methyltransferase
VNELVVFARPEVGTRKQRLPPLNEEQWHAMISNLFWKIRYRGTQHRHLQNLLDIKIGRHDIALDCGANVGVITSILARNQSRVYAFEPNPHAFQVLQRRMARHDRVTCIQAGVFVREGNAKLFLHEHARMDQVLWSSGSSILPFKSNINKNDYIDVKVVDLAAFINDLGKNVKLLKMDIEGAECEVLGHLLDTGVIRKIEHLFVERHDHKIAELRTAMRDIEARLSHEGLANVHLDWI